MLHSIQIDQHTTAEYIPHVQQSNLAIQISQTIETLRQFRIAGYAIFDLVLSFLGILLLSPILSKLFLKIRIDIPLKSWMYFTLPLGILIHIVVREFTPMTKNFLDPQGHYILKLIILVLIILGVRGIKILDK